MQSPPLSPDRLERGVGSVGQGNGLGQVQGQTDPWAQFLRNQELQQQQQQLQQQQQQLQQQQQQQPVQQPLISPMTESETMRGGVRVPSLVSEWSSNPPAGVPPVGAPNGDVLTQTRVLISQMTPQQAQMAATVLNEQLGSQARGVPERFGQLPTYVDARSSQFVAGASTGVNAGRLKAQGSLSTRGMCFREQISGLDSRLLPELKSGRHVSKRLQVSLIML